MTEKVRLHRVAAILVLVCATAWVVTGKFSAVGSETAQAAQPAPQADRPAAGAGAEAGDLRTVAVETPVFKDHRRAIRMSGNTAPDKQTVMAARTAGVIEALNVVKGQHVPRGAVILQIEGPDLKANVETAQALLDQRIQELQVAEKLFKTGNKSELALIGARSAKAAAESQLSQARAAADRLTLRAPFAGVIDAVPVQLGEWVPTGAPAATLLALDPILVKAEVSEAEVGFIVTGGRADVRLVDGRTLQGKVSFISKEASPQTRTFPIEVSLPNPDGAIPAGMTAEVTLYAPPVKSVTVPRSVITLAEDGTLGLRVVDAQNVAHFAPVRLIDDTPAGLILTGVPDDMRIIVSGQDFVKDGQKVQPVAQPAGGALE